MFVARKTKKNDCVKCHHQRGIWCDPNYSARWLCDDCLADHFERDAKARRRDALRQRTIWNQSV